jgi:phasin
MAVARKTPGKAKPAVIEAKAKTLAVSAPVPAVLAEPGADKSKIVFEKLKAVAEEATTSVETSLSTISKGVSEIHLKTLDVFKVNSDAQFAFVKALLATKSISEAITLQGEHAKTSFATLNTQAKELAALIQQVSADSVEPIKATLAKNMQASA